MSDQARMLSLKTDDQGGPFRCMDTRGIQEVLDACDRLAAQFGVRFAPHQILADTACRGKTFF